jgi:hypothetical protein
MDVAEAYRVGYLNHPDRLQVLPWNAEVDHFQTLDGGDLLAHLRQHFASATSAYDLWLV